MIKNKRRGVIRKEQILSSFKLYNFNVVSYDEHGHIGHVIVTKDYSENFNFDFNGLVKLDVTIDLKLYENFWIFSYPKFIEISNLIPKKPMFHVYQDGSLCYAPPARPLKEKWILSDFIKAVDSLINNYFCIEYIGSGTLIELEHGDIGKMQYEYLSKLNK